MGRDITKCHPRIQELAGRLVSECSKQGLKIKITDCFRTVEEQEELYAQGRTKPGNIVTNARGKDYQSHHMWGTAFDFMLQVDVDGDGQWTDDVYNDSKGYFKKVGAIGKKLGLEWGGDWKSPVDKPHFQLPDWGSTTKKLKSTYGTPDKFKATWSAASVGGSMGSKEAYVVKKGDTLSEIAQMFGCTVKEVADYNGIKNMNAIDIGQVIKNPKYVGSGVSGSEGGVSVDVVLPTIKKGSRGSAVEVWQVIVGVESDGIFGQATDSATRKFQRTEGLAVDGIVGRKSWGSGLSGLNG